jgi:hypothetical protein
MSTLIRTLTLDYDLVEVHYSPLLKNKPYLVRVYNWGGSEPEELRLDEKELTNLYSILQEKDLL